MWERRKISRNRKILKKSLINLLKTAKSEQIDVTIPLASNFVNTPETGAL